MSEPHDEYTRRLRERQAEHAACDQRRFVVGMVRFAVFLGGFLVAYGAFARGWFSGWWLLVPVAGFVALGARLTALERDSARLGRAEVFYEHGLLRLAGEWQGRGESGARFLEERHRYARDLDLFGDGSLFELLCRARTRVGEETLAAWLLAPAPADQVVARQEAVRELAGMLDLRERVAVAGERAHEGVNAARLAAWGERPRSPISRRFLLLARGLTVVGAATIALGLVAMTAAMLAANGDPRFVAWTGPWIRAYLLAALFAFGLLSWRFERRAEPIFHAAEEAARDVGLLAGVLACIEGARFDAPALQRLRADLDTGGQPPSRRIARLERLMERVLQRDNMLVRLIGPLLLWDVHLAWALEEWRATSGAGVRRWLAAVGEIEALGSLASHHYERPADVFPQVSDAGVQPGGARFDAEALAHPLLPAARAVPNDVALGGDGARVWVVSGSNMSGKSTLLRSIGVAAVLAQAGGTVCAARLSMSSLAVGASIRVSDSLQEGESRFYAEILRLGEIVASAGARPPGLFLIDEFLHGTNSHDRRIGAAAIVRGLVDRGAIGLITTHDLALTGIADELGERGANVHFEDHLEDGRMSFDYRLRAGVVEKSNALELMRSVGLDV
jgi:hypothetical protein